MADRAALIKLIDDALNGKTNEMPLYNRGILPTPGQVITTANSDPLMELALQTVRRRYPLAVSKTEAFDLRPSGNPGEIYGKSIRLAPTAAYPPNDESQYPYAGTRPPSVLDALDTLRHELSHIMGAQDDRVPQWNAPVSAYDVSDASHGLHQDIELPKTADPVRDLIRQKLRAGKP